MTPKQLTWLLRFALPLAVFVTAFFCGQTVSGAFATVGLTAAVIAISMIEIFGIIGILFAGVVGIYARNAERALREPDAALFLLMGVPATLLTAGLIATFLKS